MIDKLQRAARNEAWYITDEGESNFNPFAKARHPSQRRSRLRLDRGYPALSRTQSEGAYLSAAETSRRSMYNTSDIRHFQTNSEISQTNAVAQNPSSIETAEPKHDSDSVRSRHVSKPWGFSVSHGHDLEADSSFERISETDNYKWDVAQVKVIVLRLWWTVLLPFVPGKYSLLERQVVRAIHTACYAALSIL